DSVRLQRREIGAARDRRDLRLAFHRQPAKKMPADRTDAIDTDFHGDAVTDWRATRQTSPSPLEGEGGARSRSAIGRVRGDNDHPSHRRPGQPLFAVGPGGFDRKERSNGSSLSALEGGEGLSLCEQRDYASTFSRYPTPLSVRMSAGRSGSASIFWRSWRI